ncbi:hypothetical protein ACOMHN_043502 [Nucella lapillus]
MTMRIPLAGNTHLTLISAYAPTMTYPEEEKELVYQVLKNTLHSVPRNDKLLLLGDFNARVGKNSGAWPDIIGPQGLGRENANGLLLLTLFSEEGLTITNTLFEQPEIHKVTWMHPGSRHWHLIDYIITRRRDIRDILITRTMRGADCWTDHILLRCRAAFRLARKHRRQASDVRKKLDVKKLKEPHEQQALKDAFADSLPPVPQADDDIEAAWSSFRDAVYNSAKSVLGHPRKKHQDWFDENNKEILDLLAEKRVAHVAWLNDRNGAAKHECFKKLRSEAQSKIRQMKDVWCGLRRLQMGKGRLWTSEQCHDTYPSNRWYVIDGENSDLGALDSALQPAVKQDLHS